jgi:DNA-binding transcriptional ArsR family regulator
VSSIEHLKKMGDLAGLTSEEIEATEGRPEELMKLIRTGPMRRKAGKMHDDMTSAIKGLATATVAVLKQKHEEKAKAGAEITRLKAACDKEVARSKGKLAEAGSPGGSEGEEASTTSSGGRTDGTPVSSTAGEVALDNEDVLILKALHDKYPCLLNLYNIESEIRVSRRSIGSRVKRLKEAGIVEHPKGEKQGIWLTSMGRARTSELFPNSSP